MTVAANPLVPKDGTITIADATGSPLSFTLAYEDGDFQIGPLMPGQWRRQEYKDRGVPYAVRKVEKMSIPFSFTCHAVGIIGDGTTALMGDVALKLAAWASAVSKIAAAAGDADLYQLVWTGERSDLGATADSSITLKYCAFEIGFSEGDPGKIDVTGIAYALSTDFMTIA